MSNTRVLLLCGNRFAIPALQEMLFFKQLAVVAVPRDCDEMLEQVVGILVDSGVPLLVLDKADFVAVLTEAIERYSVNIGLVMTFRYKIPASLYSLPEKGFFNVHPGPLPGYRGADPVFQQIKNREKQAGVSIHKLDEGMDTGNIVNQQMIRLEKTDTHGLLTSKLAQVAAGMVRSLLKLVDFDLTIHSRPQDESGAVSHKKQIANDVIINWSSMNSATIIALINACNPWNKGAVTGINNKIMRLLEAEALPATLPGDGILPGTVIRLDDQGMVVATINGGAILVHLVYVDEGFLLVGRLADLGIIPGPRFDFSKS